eukprot:scaffold34620_cov69-Phaeocystis_antarctica.AAC.5
MVSRRPESWGRAQPKPIYDCFVLYERSAEQPIHSKERGMSDEGGSTASRLVTATKRSVSRNARRGLASTPRAWSLEYRNGTMLRNTPTTRGRVPVQKARSGGRALKQERRPQLVSVTSQWHAVEAAN